MSDLPSAAVLLVAAGGGLSLALLQRLRQEKLGLPGAVGLLAPWCDLRKSGDTLTTLTGIDPVLQVGGARMQLPAVKTTLEGGALVLAGARMSVPESGRGGSTVVPVGLNFDTRLLHPPTHPPPTRPCLRVCVLCMFCPAVRPEPGWASTGLCGG